MRQLWALAYTWYVVAQAPIGLGLQAAVYKIFPTAREVLMRHSTAFCLAPTPRLARHLLVAAGLVCAAWPAYAAAKKAKGVAPAAPAAAAAQVPDPAPPPTPAPPLAQPPVTPTLGADNAKDLDPAVDPEWTIGDRRPHQRPHHLALSVGLWPPTTVSGSLWYAVPAVPNGFIPAINDSFDVEFGAIVAGYFDGPDHGAVIPAVGGRWNFHVTRNFAPFVTLKLAMQFGFGPSDPNLFNAGVSLGTLLRVADWAHLRFELGYPQGLSVGVSFPIGG